jgi:hypothetical protein
VPTHPRCKSERTPERRTIHNSRRGRRPRLPSRAKRQPRSGGLLTHRRCESARTPERRTVHNSRRGGRPRLPSRAKLGSSLAETRTSSLSAKTRRPPVFHIAPWWGGK